MTPDDPRHGTVAGHIAHQRSDRDYCAPCIRAKAMYDKRRKWDEANGRGYTVSAIGARRRIQALQAIGWSKSQIGAAAGWANPYVIRSVERADGRNLTITRTTHNRVAEAYERLCMQEPPDPLIAARVKTWARKAGGYAPPLAWDDIDDPDEQPNLGGIDNQADPVVVARIIGRDMTLARAATPTERRAVVAGWAGSLAELERLTGWRADRYIVRSEGAA